MKKRNPNDSTFRNINALKKQIAALNSRCDRYDRALLELSWRLGFASIAKGLKRK